MLWINQLAIHNGLSVFNFLSNINFAPNFSARQPAKTNVFWTAWHSQWVGNHLSGFPPALFANILKIVLRQLFGKPQWTWRNPMTAVKTRSGATRPHPFPAFFDFNQTIPKLSLPEDISSCEKNTGNEGSLTSAPLSSSKSRWSTQTNFGAHDCWCYPWTMPPGDK